LNIKKKNLAGGIYGLLHLLHKLVKTSAGLMFLLDPLVRFDMKTKSLLVGKLRLHLAKGFTFANVAVFDWKYVVYFKEKKGHFTTA
jgi:hypothetical protein